MSIFRWRWQQKDRQICTMMIASTSNNSLLMIWGAWTLAVRFFLLRWRCCWWVVWMTDNEAVLQILCNPDVACSDPEARCTFLSLLTLWSRWPVAKWNPRFPYPGPQPEASNMPLRRVHVNKLSIEWQGSQTSFRQTSSYVMIINQDFKSCRITHC